MLIKKKSVNLIETRNDRLYRFLSFPFVGTIDGHIWFHQN